MRESLALLIPVFNNLSYTKSCINGLKKIINPEKVKIIVADDNSTDGTAQWIKENHPDVILLKGNGSLWWSGSVNLAMKYVMDNHLADYMLWWNNDIVPADGYFTQLGELLSTLDPNVVIGSKIYASEDLGTVWSMGGRFNPHTGKRFMHAYMQADNDGYSEPLEADWLPGMGSVFHRSVVEKIGYVDEKDFPQYHGDSDYTLRAKKAGFKIIIYPQLKIWNDISNSGQLHGETFKGLINSFTLVKSKYNIIKDLKFFKRHAKSPVAYFFLLKEYFKYVGGFFKWQFIGLFKKSHVK